MVNADPARTPTFAMFAKPDYFLEHRARATCSAPCVTPEHRLRLGPRRLRRRDQHQLARHRRPGGQANLGLDGTAANAGPNSAGPNSGQVTVPGSGTTGHLGRRDRHPADASCT